MKTYHKWLFAVTAVSTVGWIMVAKSPFKLEKLSRIIIENSTEPEPHLGPPPEPISYLSPEETLHFITTITNITAKGWVNSIWENIEVEQRPLIPTNTPMKKYDGPYSILIPPEARITYPGKTWNGVSLPVMAADPYGGLGNCMGQYSTLYALNKIYNVSVFNVQKMNKFFHMFDNLSIPLIKDEEYYDLKPRHVSYTGWGTYNFALLEVAAAGLLGPERFLTTAFSMENQLFHTYRQELIWEFRFNNTYRSLAQQFFHSISLARQQINLPDPVFISFHIRRTNFKHHLELLFNGTLPEKNYFNRATKYYRDKFPGQAVFILVSDDRKFALENVDNKTDVYLFAGKTREEDMAVATSCNHSIITTGSFGFFIGFLTGGEVVYPDIEVPKNPHLYRFSRYKYEHIGLKDFIYLPVD